MVIPGSTNYELSIGVDPKAEPLQTASPQNFFTNYERVVPGRYSLRITKAGSREVTIKTLDASIPDKGYFTAMIYQDSAGQLIAELVDDTPDAKAPTNKLVIRQFCRDARAVVTSGAQRTAALEYGQSQAFGDMPAGRIPVQVRAVTPKGVRNCGGEADFSIRSRETAFVVADPYGRMRLRFMIDGPDPETEKENREAASSLLSQ